MTDVTTELLRPTDVDETAYAAFLANTTKHYKKLRDKANARGNGKGVIGMYLGWTDEQCAEAARSYCGAYRHQFRVLVPVAPGTPR